MRKRLRLRHYLGGVILVSLMGFQNCSAPNEEGDADLNSTSSYTQSLPFAYKASLDTLAYMSCSRMESTYERRAFFTFRAGAYTPSAGLEITPEFLDATKYYSLQAKADAFAQSIANADTRLQLAIRSSTNFQSVAKEEHKALKNGESLGTMMGDLSSSPLVEHLVTMQSGVKKHYFPSAASERLMASSLRFNDDGEGLASTLRAMLKNHDLFLALTYTSTDNAEDKNARAPEGANPITSVYGTGYQLDFGIPSKWTSAEQRVLHSVNEVSLAQGMGPTGSTWTCPADMQFVVVRNDDIDKVKPCNLWPDDPVSSLTQRQQYVLDVVRRVLPVEDFYVDVQNHCVVAKNHIADQSCYGSRAGLGMPDYTSKNCVVDYSDPNNIKDTCPHFVSVCVKNP